MRSKGVTWLTNNFHVQKIQSDCILTITMLQLTCKAWRSIVLSLCYPLIVPGLPVQYLTGQRESSCELGEHFSSSVGHSEGWIWFCDKDYWRNTNSRIFTPTKVGACTICFLHWLEVFSEDIPCNVLWYNCGTKWCNHFWFHVSCLVHGLHGVWCLFQGWDVGTLGNTLGGCVTQDSG